MGRYIARRVLQGVGTLLLVMLLLHLLTTVAIQLNGNPAQAFFGDKVASESQLAAVEQRFDLDDPCFDQVGNPCLGPFVERLGEYARGDFGTNLRGREVSDIVATAAPNTLRLFVVVLLTWLTLGMVLGSVAARRRGSASDHGIRLTSVLIDAFPVFVLLIVYRYVVAVPLHRWAEETFGEDSWPPYWFKPSFDADHPWATVVVPGILLGLAGSAAFIRLVRAGQLESYQGDHVRTARSKGLAERHVVVHHVVRNSSVPVVTAVGLTFAEALGGAVITEGLMNIYGMGGVLWEAVRNDDVGLVLGVVTLLAAVTVVVMIVVDIAYALLDPRIRYE
ncbi:ABC transporter permease [Myceligenerans xiligouense]|uniref:Peptide/nickel transport system permease protein/oligopeptide transport system permease protein n=1 Tax=Myceligenerans xiligouense TaxID=253184 RepID=A0A3N4ZGJ2_9MICO|nr:ABC transporter permease [Myceligenerans xiligouense]RPF19975.1 peptide/nickel transport system permease protein/oligopeptide transport system permease protein [Myceligenerans xiligouense]